MKTCSKLKWGHEPQLIGFTKRNHSATFIEGGGRQYLLTHRSAGPRKSDIFFTSSIQSNMGWTRRANAKNNGNKFSVWSVNDKQGDIKLKNLKIKLMFKWMMGVVKSKIE